MSNDHGWTQQALGEDARRWLESVPDGMPPEKWAAMNRAERRAWKRSKRA